MDLYEPWQYADGRQPIFFEQKQFTLFNINWLDIKVLIIFIYYLN